MFVLEGHCYVAQCGAIIDPMHVLGCAVVCSGETGHDDDRLRLKPNKCSYFFRGRGDFTSLDPRH